MSFIAQIAMVSVKVMFPECCPQIKGIIPIFYLSSFLNTQLFQPCNIYKKIPNYHSLLIFKYINLKENELWSYMLGIPGQETGYESDSEDKLAPDEDFFFQK